MDKFYNLTRTEKDIMELLWELNQPLSFKEIMDYLNEKLNKQWKKQTVGTYLTGLQKAGLIQVEKRGVHFYIYYPTCTKKEYKQRCVKKLIEDSFDNSITKFVSAFTGGEKLSEEDAEEIKKLLK